MALNLSIPPENPVSFGLMADLKDVERALDEGAALSGPYPEEFPRLLERIAAKAWRAIERGDEQKEAAQ